MCLRIGEKGKDFQIRDTKEKRITLSSFIVDLFLFVSFPL